MGLMDKAKDAVHGNEDKTDAAVDKVGDAVDSRTGDKHSDKIDTVQGKADDAL